MTTCGDDIKYQTYLQQVVVPVQFNLPMSLRPMGQEVKQVPPWLAQVTGVGVELGGGIKIVGVAVGGGIKGVGVRVGLGGGGIVGVGEGGTVAANTDKSGSGSVVSLPVQSIPLVPGIADQIYQATAGGEQFFVLEADSKGA